MHISFFLFKKNYSMNHFYNKYCPKNAQFKSLEQVILKKDTVNAIKYAFLITKKHGEDLVFMFIEHFVVFRIGYMVPNMPFFVSEFYAEMKNKLDRKNAKMIIIIMLVNGLCNCKTMEEDLSSLTNVRFSEVYRNPKFEDLLDVRTNYKKCFVFASWINCETVLQVVKDKLKARNLRIQRIVCERLEEMWKRYKTSAFVYYAAMYCCFNQIVDTDDIWNPSDYRKGFKLSPQLKKMF